MTALPVDPIAGRYEIVGLLGRGAMAEGYEVLDVGSGAVLALKRLLPERAGSRSATLFLKREYETLPSPRRSETTRSSTNSRAASARSWQAQTAPRSRRNMRVFCRCAA